MKRYYIIYKGRVQGVGFRYRLMCLADKYHLTGYVRNRLNGDVDCEVQGEDIDAFLKESLEKDYFIKINDYSIKEIPLKENDGEFTVRF